MLSNEVGGLNKFQEDYSHRTQNTVTSSPMLIVAVHIFNFSLVRFNEALYSLIFKVI